MAPNATGGARSASPSRPAGLSLEQPNMSGKPRKSQPGMRVQDRAFKWITTGAALVVLGLVALIVYELGVQSWPSIRRYGLGFIKGTTWDPISEEFGALPFIYGTVVSSLLALVLAVPVSLGVAVFLSEIAPVRLRRTIGFVIEILASIPSVIYGLWGIFALTPVVRAIQPVLSAYLGFLPLFQGPPLGFGMLTAGILLALMIIPTITALSRDVLNAVPNHQREASLALGATRWETIRYAVIPYNKTGIIGAIMLGLGRALGETMAVTMVIGNQPIISSSLFMPAQTMASLIANEFTEASSDIHLSVLIEIGLLLFFVTFVLNIVARLTMMKLNRKEASR